MHLKKTLRWQKVFFFSRVTSHLSNVGAVVVTATALLTRLCCCCCYCFCCCYWLWLLTGVIPLEHVEDPSKIEPYKEKEKGAEHSFQVQTKDAVYYFAADTPELMKVNVSLCLSLYSASCLFLFSLLLYLNMLIELDECHSSQCRRDQSSATA